MLRLFLLLFTLTLFASANELEDSQELILPLKYHSKLHNLDFNNVIVVQGPQKKLPPTVYTILNEQLIEILGASKHHTVIHTERQPYLTITGTPTSLKISNSSQKKLQELAIEYDADAIFLWDLMVYKKNLYFTARIIRTTDNSTIWTYQEDLKNLQALRDAQLRYDGPLEIPLQSFIILSGNLDYILDPYKRDAVDSDNDALTQYMLGMSLEYLTTTTWNPKLSFGVLYTFSTSLSSDLSLVTNQLMVDFRYQLNDYTPPVYDTSTGKVIEIRNRQKYSMGVALGAAQMDVQSAPNKQMSLATKVYFIATFTESLEYNVGLSYIGEKRFFLDPDTAYSQNAIDIGGANVYMSVGYKFKLYKDK